MSEFFVRRPIVAIVIAILMTLIGGVCILALPIAQYPQIAPPEIQVFAAGPPDKLNRSVDLAPLSSWLAVRTIDRETRRLDAIERGEPPPATAALPTLVSPDPAPDPSLTDVPMPGRDPRRAVPAKPKAAPTPKAPQAAPAAPSPPLASQQAAPLPPPIEVRPAPGPPPAKPRPKPPLVLTPSNP